MFEFTHSERIGIFIDNSNISHPNSKFVRGWSYDMINFFDVLEKEEIIKEVHLYGAINKKKQEEVNFIEQLKLKFSGEKFKYYFPTLEKAGGVEKGNVDMALRDQIRDNVDNRNTLILFSGDVDFLDSKILGRLMERGKQVIMISNKFTANKKVVDYKDPNYMYIDTNHTEEKYAIIKSILKDKNKTIVDILPKKLIEKLSRISIDEKQKIIEWAINIQNKRYLNKEEIPSTFMNGGKDLTYIDRDLIYSDDKKGLKIVNVIFYGWSNEEKKEFIEYLQNLGKLSPEEEIAYLESKKKNLEEEIAKLEAKKAKLANMIGMNSLINSNVLQKQNLSNSDNPFSLFN